MAKHICPQCNKEKPEKKFHSNWDESGPFFPCKQCLQEHDDARRKALRNLKARQS